MAEQYCEACKNAEKGLLEINSKQRMDLVRIETMMSCGCGGNVTHTIFLCKKCNKYYLIRYEAHWPPSSEDIYIYEINKSKAIKAVLELKKCKNLESDSCQCTIHKNSEQLHAELEGEKKYFKSL